MFASIPEITDINALLDVVDGVVLTGARANVHPTEFGCAVRAIATVPRLYGVFTGSSWIV